MGRKDKVRSRSSSLKIESLSVPSNRLRLETGTGMSRTFRDRLGIICEEGAQDNAQKSRRG